VITPLRRMPDGRFEPVGWDEAMTDIANRLTRIHREHGSGAIGWYFGNPGAFSYSHTLWLRRGAGARGACGEGGADPGMTRVGSPSTAIQQAELTR
jgi:anaerobic selenocysteine-containing dehydrogenase